MVLFSALLSALPYSVPSLFFLSWFSLVPFFLALTRDYNRFRSNLWLGFLFGFSYHLFTYWWFYTLYPMDFAGVSEGVSLLIVLLGWAGISLLHGCLYVLPGAAVYFAKKTRFAAFSAGAFALAFLGAEWITELGPLAFPWIRLSIGQFRAPILLQTASFWGVYGVDLLILAVNMLFALTILRKSRHRFIAGAMALCLFALNLGFGFIRFMSFDAFEAENTPVSVAAIQGNILSGEKWGDNSVARCMETYLDLSESSPDDTELIVWPETAIPTDLSRDYNRDVLRNISALSRKTGVPVLTGAFWTLEDRRANAAVLVTHSGVSAPYAKRHLVPFGEAVPYRGFFEAVFPFMTEINMLSEDLVPGSSPAVMETDKGALGCLICFESIFPSLARDSAAAGADAFAVVTNDSWYKDSPAVYQHLAHAALRSIENGRYTVRAANSGVSAIIDPRGSIRQELGPLQKGIVSGQIRMSEIRTGYTSAGDIVLPLYAGLVCLWGLVLLIRSRRRHGSN
ncbi:MAG: apolipoprotein N-acyltransferase [Clostridia bacterium]|nr:apolipoprotein N-acyltransferase [Clostridia bacterium]